MRIFLLFFSLILAAFAATAAWAVPLIEYHMQMKPSPEGQKRVALTFDACTGKTDTRILDALVKNEIKATIFVTGRWLKRNPEAIATFKAHPELFEIENHGAQHLPAIDVPQLLYGLKPAGSPAAVSAEVEDGAAAVQTHFYHWPHWYRGAGGEYTASSLELIKSLGFEVGGFTTTPDDKGIALPANVRLRFVAWPEIEKVLLRYGVLTIDCADNKLLQLDVAQPTFSAESFEQYCDEKVEEGKKKRHEEW